MDVNATCVASLVALAGRCQWKSEPAKDENKRLGLATDKKNANASKQNSSKISEAETWLFCVFTFMQFYLFLFSFTPFIQENSSFVFVCLS